MNEVAVDLRGDELRRRPLRNDDVDDVFAVEATGLAEYGLLPVVVLVFAHHEVEPILGPTGKGPRRLADVVLGVVADTHREHLEHLSTEVLVRVALQVLAVVEVDEHRRVFRHSEQEVSEAAEAVLLEQFDLHQELAVVADLGVRSGEVAVPEERELLLERALADQHALSPPEGDSPCLEDIAAQQVEEAIDDRLQRSVERRVDLDTHRLTELVALPYRVCPTLGEGVPCLPSKDPSDRMGEAPAWAHPRSERACGPPREVSGRHRSGPPPDCRQSRRARAGGPPGPHSTRRSSAESDRRTSHWSVP